MKNFLKLLTFSLMLNQGAEAAIVVCGIDTNEAIQTGIEETLTGTCDVLGVDLHEKSGWAVRRLKMKLSGVGLVAKVIWSGGYIFTCPNVLYRNFHQQIFRGVNASASVIFGVEGGVFANKRGGVCLLTGGYNGAIGAGIIGSKIEFDEIE